jgi:hypothetical protein
MGFDKRIISKNTLKIISNLNDYEQFYKYFLSDAILTEDKFSLNILKEIEKCTIEDKDKIVEIMNKCKL